jgi:flagellar biosynthetic protein FliQ
MNPESVLDIALEGVLITAKLAAPLLLTALAVGFGISLLQSITQIQEVTLSFVPKALAVATALVVSGNWMISEAVAFTNTMFERIPGLLSGG